MDTSRYNFGLFVNTVLFLFNASCISFSEQTKQKSKNLVFNKIAMHELSIDLPLGGHFSAGTKIFNDADPISEAREIYTNYGVNFVASSIWLVPPGIDDLKLAKEIIKNKYIRVVKIPATSDVVPAGGKEYQDAAFRYASKFNKQMLIFTEKEIVEKKEDLTAGEIICNSQGGKKPLGGTFANGIQIVAKSDPIKDAYTFFKKNRFILFLAQSSLTPPGVANPKEALKLHKSLEFTFCMIPETGDVYTKENTEYQEAVHKYASDFNQEMLLLKYNKK